MGVSIEVYRQRIGCFVRALSSFKARGNNSNTYQKQSKDSGTALRVIIRLGCLALLVAAVIQSSPSVLDLTQFGDVEKNPGPNTDLVNDLHPLLRQKICKKLDIKHPTGGNYRELAACFDMPNDYIIAISQNPDPTHNVLQWVGGNPKNTVANLRKALQAMRREDCVNIIDEDPPSGLVGGEGKNETKRQLVETDKKVDETTKKFKMGESLVRQEAEGSGIFNMDNRELIESSSHGISSNYKQYPSGKVRDVRNRLSDKFSKIGIEEVTLEIENEEEVIKRSEVIRNKMSKEYGNSGKTALVQAGASSEKISGLKESLTCLPQCSGKEGSVMSSNTFFINDVECCSSGDVIDLRDAGFLKTSIPAELLNHPKIKTILLCHEEVLKFLKSIIDDLGPQVSINIFNEYNKSCEIKTNNLGLIGLDVRCNAVNVVGAIAACEPKLRRLVMRNYDCDALIGLDRTTISNVEELVIMSGDTLSANLGHHYFLLKKIESFSEFSIQNVLGTSGEYVTKLDSTSAEPKTISLEGMTNLQKLLLCAKGKRILPTGMDQLLNLQELFIFDVPIGDNFELSGNLKLRKLVLYNCGLKVFPGYITAMEELEVLQLYLNDFYNQSISLTKLLKLQRLSIFDCKLDCYPEELENFINLETLKLCNNPHLGIQSFSISRLKNLKKAGYVIVWHEESSGWT